MTAKHIVCLSFDFDVWSGYAARGQTSPTPVSQGEFAIVGAKRILKLLKQHDIQSTWFVPGVVIDSYEDDVRAVFADGHEIGHHGYSHRAPSMLGADLEEHEMVKAIDCISRITGKAPAGYRSAAWDLSSRTVSLLVKHGFIYDSSMMGNDMTPYHVRDGDQVSAEKPIIFGKTTKLVEMPVSWSLDDHPHFEFYRMDNMVLPGLRSSSDVLENFVDDFKYMTQTCEWGVLTYTFHPHVIGRGHRMLMLHRLIENLSELNANFMSMESAVEAFRCR